MTKEQLKRTPVLVEFDELKNKNIIRTQYVIQNPLASNIKLSNGTYSLNIYMTKYGPEIYLIDKNGNTKLLK